MKRNNAQISILDEIIVDNFAVGGGCHLMFYGNSILCKEVQEK